MHKKNYTKQVLSVTETNTRGKFPKKKKKKTQKWAPCFKLTLGVSVVSAISKVSWSCYTQKYKYKWVQPNSSTYELESCSFMSKFECDAGASKPKAKKTQ